MQIPKAVRVRTLHASPCDAKVGSTCAAKAHLAAVPPNHRFPFALSPRNRCERPRWYHTATPRDEKHWDPMGLGMSKLGIPVVILWDGERRTFGH